MFFLGLAAAETGLRAFDLGPPPMPIVQGHVIADVPEPKMRFDNVAGGTLRITYQDRRNGPTREVEARVNAHGMRGEDVELAKPPNTLRIACLGDSHTFGYGVGEGESWPDVLARTLRGRSSTPAIEVLNFGVNAYDTEQEVAQLESRALEFQPDIVLIGYYLNDTALRGLKDVEGTEPGFWVKLLDRRRGGWIGWMREHSRLVELTADSGYRRISNEFYARSRSAGYAPEHPGWIRVQEALRHARELTAARHAKLGVVLIPFLFREKGVLGSHAAFEVVQEFCRSENLPCLDLEPAFADADVDALRVHPHDYHATPKAHAIIGEAVAKWLEERAWSKP